MRVTLCVDALAPHPGGIGRYTWELCRRLGDHERIERLHFYGRNQVIDEPARLLDGEAPRGAGNKLQRWWRQRPLRASIVHGPNYFLPAFAETGVITVHDLSVFRYPETHPAERVRAFEHEFERSLARAAHIITDTETVRLELIEDFAVPPHMVTSVLLGVDPAYRPIESDTLQAGLARWELTAGGYGLCVSTLEPRKRISQLMTAWRNLPRSIRDRCPLVLCGGAGWRNDSLRAQVEAGQAEGWLRHLGFVDESLLPQLYAGAALFVYPSIYEGFGLPPLEAMASGVPVMVSRRSCLPEVCGEAARYFDPDDIDGFGAAIEQNLADREWRIDSARRGLARARELSWDRCIGNTVEVYSKVAGVI